MLRQTKCFSQWSTRPLAATPIRVRALQLFAAARAAGEPAASVDGEVSRIARLMDYAPSEPLEVNARDFLLAATLLAAEADGSGMNLDEWEAFLEVLVPVSADPEADAGRLATREDAEALLDASAEYLRKNAGPERYELLAAVAHVVASDGTIGESERAFLHTVAAKLEIPERAADEIAIESLADHLQLKAIRGTTIPRAKLPRRSDSGT